MMMLAAVFLGFIAPLEEDPWSETRAPEDALKITATLPQTEFVVGEEIQISLEIELKEGWSAGASGIPEPIVQILPPPGIQLSGKILTTHQELASNEFLQEPFERILKAGTRSIGFQFTELPVAEPSAPHQTLSITVLAYVSQPPGDNSWFVRKRLELPLRPGAKASGTFSQDSKWGQAQTLQIGDEVQSFRLPQSSGEDVSLDTYLGEKNIIVTTYRAFW